MQTDRAPTPAEMLTEAERFLGVGAVTHNTTENMAALLYWMQRAVPFFRALAERDAKAGEGLREDLERALAIHFSQNRQPCMSGDPRDRLSPLQRRNMNDAVDAILSLAPFADYAAGRRAGLEEAAEARLMAWCVHVRGPDDVVPVPDYETAIALCDAVNEQHRKIVEKDPSDNWPRVSAVPAPWPYGAASYAESAARGNLDYGVPPFAVENRAAHPPAPPADLEAAVAAERALVDEVINAAGMEAHDVGDIAAEQALAGLKLTLSAIRARGEREGG